MPRPVFNSALGVYFTNLRVGLGWSQNHAESRAKSLGLEHLTRNVIWRLEGGKIKSPSAEVLKDAATLYRVDYDQLAHDVLAIVYALPETEEKGSERPVHSREMGDVFRRLRVSSKLSTAAAARRAQEQELEGLSQTMIWRLEAGQIKYPSREIVRATSILYGARYDELAATVAEIIYAVPLRSVSETGGTDVPSQRQSDNLSPSSGETHAPREVLEPVTASEIADGLVAIIDTATRLLAPLGVASPAGALGGYEPASAVTRRRSVARRQRRARQ